MRYRFKSLKNKYKNKQKNKNMLDYSHIKPDDLIGKKIKWFECYGEVKGFDGYQFFSIRKQDGKYIWLKLPEIVRSLVVEDKLPPRKIEVTKYEA